jgi:ribosomal protein S18 acetylase RimI-like enzyme
MPIYGYRLAKRGDAAEIFDVLEGVARVAPEIPMRLDTSDRKEFLFKRIRLACVYRTVFIAELHRDNQIVGFLMAEPLGRELDLSYGGVRADHRGQHIFPKLVKKMMAKGVPLTATVKHLNKSGTVDRLLKLGFTKVESLVDGQDNFRWQPGPTDIQGGGLS